MSDPVLTIASVSWWKVFNLASPYMKQHEMSDAILPWKHAKLLVEEVNAARRN